MRKQNLQDYPRGLLELMAEQVEREIAEKQELLRRIREAIPLASAYAIEHNHRR
jgi:hypothetical protein